MARQKPQALGGKSAAHQPKPVTMVAGRLVGPTLADPELQGAVAEAAKTMFPSRAAALKYFQKRGVLTAKGNLTKRAGG
jgi:hypothetical protein